MRSLIKKLSSPSKAAALAAAQVQGRLVRVAAQAQAAAPERTGTFGAGRWWFLVRAEGRKRCANASFSDAGRLWFLVREGDRKRFANALCNDAGRWLLLVRAEGRSRSADEVSSIET